MTSLLLTIALKAGTRKQQLLTCMIATTLFSPLAIPVQLAAQNALGLKYTVLYTFTGGTDGGAPTSDLTPDGQGNLYGTTNAAGDPTCNCGTVFKFDVAGNHLTTLHAFTGSPDGSGPLAGVTRDDSGNVYGTTEGGGQSIFGTVFTIDHAGQESLLVSFLNAPPADGNGPYYGGLFRDSDGTLYGTTAAGGDLSKCNGGCGEVFKVDPSGQLTILYKFQGTDGAFPVGRLVRDANGNFYGTTEEGGISGCFGSCGVVFKIDPSGQETVVYPFTGGADGANPSDGVILDANGNLYGTAAYGAGNGCFGPGCGVVFRIDTNNNNQESTLYTFTGGVDGGQPLGGLVRDPQGNLYGTTYVGGNNDAQAGVVFKLDTTGRETVLYPFSGGTDGGAPNATSLVRDSNGNLFGLTQTGGDSGCGFFGSCGVLFKISACHTAICHGEDDADTTSSAIDQASADRNAGVVAPANPVLRDRATQAWLATRPFPGYRPVGSATAPTN
jgi:uncharacterized repeat protein (TIGR03803 family)